MFCFLSYLHYYLTYWGAEEDPAMLSPFTAIYSCKISDIFVESLLHLLLSVLELMKNGQLTFQAMYQF